MGGRHGPVVTVGVRRRTSSTNLNPPSSAPDTLHRTLSRFQVEKFSYMFGALFDLERNGLIEEGDMRALADKMAGYAGWGREEGEDGQEMYKSVLDVQMIFLECLQDQAKMEKAASAEDEVIESWEEALSAKQEEVTSITLTQWLNTWGRLCYGSAGLSDFPCWVQMLPGIFFKCMDLDEDGVISMDEYRDFYRDFVGVPEEDLEKVTREGYRAMTAGGDHRLTLENFNFCFANFLLGRSIYGPGKYIFGVFDNRDMDERYKVLYNLEDDSKEKEAEKELGYN